MDVTTTGPWWDAGTLTPERHYRLIQQRHAVAQRAGLGVAFMSAIWDPLPAEVSREMRQWLVNTICKQPTEHLLFMGKIMSVAMCFRALVGALLRNEVDARLMTVEEIMKVAMGEDEVEAGVLFVSDFAIKDEPRSDPVKRKLMGVIRQRINGGLPTCLYSSNETVVSQLFGPTAQQELAHHFSALVIT